MAVSSTLLLSLTACGSNSANTLTEADASPDGSEQVSVDTATACHPRFHACASDDECCAPNRCLNITGTSWCQQDGPQVGEPDANTAYSTIPDAGSCGWPASFTSSGDASSVGCWAKPTHDICKVPNGGSFNAQDGTIRGPDGQVVTDACQDACLASEYALTCTGDGMMPASMPSPDTSLGCTAIPVPTPSNVLFYCCPCGGHSSTEDAATGDAGTLILQAFGGPSGEVAAQVPMLEPGVGQQKTCASPLVAGACQLTSCQLGGIGSPRPGYGNFGPISASVGTTTVPLTYDGVGYGTVYFPPSITLGMGGTMRFQGGNGAGVPTFDVSATIPGLAVITSPVPTTDGGAALIDTSQDLSVTWLPISIGQIQFQLKGGSSSPGGGAISVACTFEGASGAGVVPQAFLSTLKEMSGASPTYAGLRSELDATTVANGLTIVTESFQNSQSNGRDFNVTLQ